MRHSRVLVAHKGNAIVGTLRLAAKKPWAIDVSYFTSAEKALYLTSMAVIPNDAKAGNRPSSRCGSGQACSRLAC